jgi:hypothetical protein
VCEVLHALGMRKVSGTDYSPAAVRLAQKVSVPGGVCEREFMFPDQKVSLCMSMYPTYAGSPRTYMNVYVCMYVCIYIYIYIYIYQAVHAMHRYVSVYLCIEQIYAHTHTHMQVRSYFQEQAQSADTWGTEYLVDDILKTRLPRAHYDVIHDRYAVALV